MGHGNTSSFRWDPKRKLSPAEEIAYWQSQAMQLRAELYRADDTLQRFAARIAEQNRLIASYRQAFGPQFITPRDPKEDEQ